MSREERLTNLEEFVKLMTQWTLRAEERTDELRAAQAESEAKIAALADAQIKTESVIGVFRREHERTRGGPSACRTAFFRGPDAYRATTRRFD
jgi:hypothetical protein